jgi:tetratricopeptide (TPR) repeat protein
MKTLPGSGPCVLDELMNKRYLLPIIIFILSIGCGAIRNPQDIEIEIEKEAPPGIDLTINPWSDFPTQTAGVDRDRYYHYLSAQKRAGNGNLDRAILELQKVIDLDPDTAYLQRELAMYYLRQQNSVAALDILEKVVGKDSQDTDTLFLYARTLETLDRRQKAIAVYEQLLGETSAEEMIFLRLGDLYLEDDDLDNAFRVYSRMVELYPHTYVGHFFLGKIHSAREEYEKAKEHIDRTLELLPGLEEPQYELAEIHKKMGDTSRAIEVYRNILEGNPNNIFAALELSVLYNESGSEDQAGALLSGLASKSYDDPSLYRIISQEYLDRNRYQEAVTLLEGMLDNAPDISGVSYLLGIALSGTGNTTGAIERFRHVDESSRFFLQASIQTAMLHQELGQLAAAVDHIRQTIEKHPDKQDLYMFLAIFYEEMESYENASSALMDGLKLNPEHVQMNFRLGIVYDRIGERKKSIEQMKRVIALEPLHVNALNYLGYTYADMNIHLDEAEVLIRTALEHKPNDGYITDSLGWVYFRKGYFDKAAGYLERAAQLAPEDPVICEHLGDVYLKLDQPEKALDAYRRSLLLKPEDNTPVEEKIKTLMEKRLQN